MSSHPQFEAARALLSFPLPDYPNDLDEARMRAAMGALAATHRRLAEDAVEELIEFLDGLDPDPDLEPYLAGDGEPAGGHLVDTEGDTADDEASLGWRTGWMQSGPGWSGGDDDREDEHDGAELDADSEPSLGSLGSGDPTSDQGSEWSAGCSSSDLEQDESDYEPEDDALGELSSAGVSAAADGALRQLRRITGKVQGPGLVYLGEVVPEGVRIIGR